MSTLFEADLRVAKLDALRADLAEAHPDIRFTTDYHGADVAVVFLNPSTGDYFTSTGLLDLDIHAGSNVDLAKIRDIRASVSELVVGLNVVLPWLLGERRTPGRRARRRLRHPNRGSVRGHRRRARPTGRLPLTFPIDNDAIAVDEHGSCASPNDVPGYAKEAHMGGRPYVYVDADGNRYQLGHGLSLS